MGREDQLKETDRLQTQVKTLQASVAAKAADISKLQTGYQEQGKQITSLQKAVKEKTSEADSLGKLRDDLQASISQLSEELSALRTWKDGKLRDIEQARTSFLKKVAAMREAEA